MTALPSRRFCRWRDKGIAVLCYAPFGRSRLWARVKDRPVPAWAAEPDAVTWAQFFLKFVASHPDITCITPATSRARTWLTTWPAAEVVRQMRAMRKRMIAGRTSGRLGPGFPTWRHGINLCTLHADNHPPEPDMLKIWGRKNSINAKKVLWACGELGLTYDRVDAGMAFGVNNTPEYRAMNPNGLVVIDDDGFILWESHAIVRYLARRYGTGTPGPWMTAAPRTPIAGWIGTTPPSGLICDRSSESGAHAARKARYGVGQVVPARVVHQLPDSGRCSGAPGLPGRQCIQHGRYSARSGGVSLVQPRYRASSAVKPGCMVCAPLQSPSLPGAWHGAVDLSH